ncbi:MAG: metal-sensing transcriptional repressor [Ruminococcaceae bacterium]|nr:metal-sensing transcriptional repressor [Oscillospiraceae bacterium]
MEENKTCQCNRETVRSEEERKKLINRLNRIEGQIRGIRGMIEYDAYCTDILTQSAAVSAAMSSFNRELLNNHIKGCVSRDIREGRDEVVEELLNILQKLMR